MSARTFTVVDGRDLRVGDVIAPWGSEQGANRTSKITDLKPYEGPLKNLWERAGGASTATLEPFGAPDLQFLARGMTIDPIGRYYRLNTQESAA